MPTTAARPPSGTTRRSPNPTMLVPRGSSHGPFAASAGAGSPEFGAGGRGASPSFCAHAPAANAARTSRRAAGDGVTRPMIPPGAGPGSESTAARPASLGAFDFGPGATRHGDDRRPLRRGPPLRGGARRVGDPAPHGRAEGQPGPRGVVLADGPRRDGA